jgi:alpha-tubulin suppressor-like RCC1 family protein
VTTDGAALCWGSNDFSKATPPAGAFSQVSASGEHTCGLKTDGTVACWGANTDSLAETYFGQATPPGGTYTQVSASWQYTCALRTDRTVACWGDDDYGKSTPP